MSESLKEFEKWFEEQDLVSAAKCLGGFTSDDVIEAAETSWKASRKAALEWIRDVGALCEGELVDELIKEELEE